MGGYPWCDAHSGESRSGGMLLHCHIHLSGACGQVNRLADNAPG